MPLLTSIPVKSSNTSAAFSNDGSHPANRTNSSCACGLSFPGSKANSSSRGKNPLPTLWTNAILPHELHLLPASRFQLAFLLARAFQLHPTLRTHLARSSFFPIRRRTRHRCIREHLRSQSSQLLIYFGLNLPKGCLRMLLPPVLYLFHHLATLFPPFRLQFL